MSILTRYLLQQALHFLWLCILGGACLYFVIDFFDYLDRLIRFGATLKNILLFMAYKIPFIVYQVIPASMLLSVFLTLGIMTRHNEIIALRLSGIKTYRIIYPLLSISMLMSIGAFLLNEYVVPSMKYKSEYIYQHVIKGITPRSQLVRDRFLFKGEKGIYIIASYDSVNKELQGVTLMMLSRPMRLDRRIDARRATWNGKEWVFHDIEVRDFGPHMQYSLERYKEKVIDVPEVPEDFQQFQKLAEEMSFRELKAFTQKIRNEGYDTTSYDVDLQAKLSYPFLTLITVFIGIPFALRSSRQGGMVVGIVLSLVIGFVYWVVFSLSLSLGKSGLLPPVLSAWIANLLFGVLGGYMLLGVKS